MPNVYSVALAHAPTHMHLIDCNEYIHDDNDDDDDDGDKNIDKTPIQWRTKQHTIYILYQQIPRKCSAESVSVVFSRHTESSCRELCILKHFNGTKT